MTVKQRPMFCSGGRTSSAILPLLLGSPSKRKETVFGRMPSFVWRKSVPQAQALPATTRSPPPRELAGRSKKRGFASDFADRCPCRTPGIKAERRKS
jgi:hypothetical protein